MAKKPSLIKGRYLPEFRHLYDINIAWSDEDEVYVVRSVRLSGLSTHGKTLVEAANMAEDAIEGYLHSLCKENIAPGKKAKKRTHKKKK